MSASHFETVRDYLDQLGVIIEKTNEAEELFVISDEHRGVTNMIVDCEDGVLVIEQMIFKVAKDDPPMYRRLLQINRDLVHGAFVLDEDGKWVIYRDTLQLANLDLNELEASINSLGLALAMHADELIAFSKAA